MSVAILTEEDGGAAYRAANLKAYWVADRVVRDGGGLTLHRFFFDAGKMPFAAFTRDVAAEEEASLIARHGVVDEEGRVIVAAQPDAWRRLSGDAGAGDLRA